MPQFTEALQNHYRLMYDTCIIKAAKYPAIDKILANIRIHQMRYEAVAKQSHIPWYFIAIVHHLECSQNFKRHLHNGDILTQRTTHIPKNRPIGGQPPFSWEESALDALTLQGLTKWTDWSIAGLLYKLEAYNGFGYRKASINIPSPYLWSFSNHYTKGKFVADGSYSAVTLSAQCGAAVLLRRLEEKQWISLTTMDKLQQIKQLYKVVLYNPGSVVAEALQLQTLLTAMGYPLRLDGRAGEMTSNVCKKLLGKYLHKDPRVRP